MKPDCREDFSRPNILEQAADGYLNLAIALGFGLGIGCMFGFALGWALCVKILK